VTTTFVARVPGSKSITNRALLCAGLATGRSTLEGALVADDTEAMAGALSALGVDVALGVTTVVDGPGVGSLRRAATIDARSSGTTARFLLPVLAVLPGEWVLDGSPQLRARPIGELADALRGAGASVEGDALPLSVRGGFTPTGPVRVAGDVTSQFLSGLMLAGPLVDGGLAVECTTDVVVARPFVDMTAAVMRAFGAADDVGGGGYRPVARYEVEPDASAASYFLAAGAILGCAVHVPGLGPGSLQGDARFADVLASMGSPLRGIDVDLRDMPDMVPTLAAVALFADGPTRLRGVGFVRAHESDRLAAVASELGKLGARVDVTDDGLVVHPAPLHGAVVDSHGDHRMAMALGVVGLRVPGVVVEGAGAVDKTFPGFWDALASLRASCT
jgi:3-phosphoshikimate 1-carboxyvinyltransferase